MSRGRDRDLDPVPLGTAIGFWTKLGLINFGGPTGQIAIMHQELVERRGWLDEDRFLHALSFCMLLPGPEAQQLAIYVGWLLNGIPGGIAAGSLFVLPAAVLMLVLAFIYAAHGDLPGVAGVVDGLSAAVVGIVAVATITIARRAIPTTALRSVAATVFLAIFVVGVPFPLVVLGAGAAGLIAGPIRPTWFPVRESSTPADDSLVTERTPPSRARAAKVLGVGLVIWIVPLVIVGAIAGTGSVYAREGWFFASVAVVSFGGAYAVLAYVGHEVVTRFGLSTADVVAGLGLAETTPGPLILVVEFLGFVAAYRSPGGLDPAVAGTIGALVTLWATFVPSFLWIFLGAPSVERIRGNARLRAGLSAITASVVGVIVSLALSVAGNVLFSEGTVVHPFLVDIRVPVWSSIQVGAALIAVAAFVAMRRFHVHVVWIVLASGALGLLWSVLR